MEFEKLKEQLIMMMKEGKAFQDEGEVTNDFSHLEKLFFQEYEKKAKTAFQNLYSLSLDIKKSAMEQTITESKKVKTFYEFIKFFSSESTFPEDTDLDIDIDLKNKSVTIRTYTPDCELFECKIDKSFNSAIEKIEAEFKEIFYLPSSVVFGIVRKESIFYVDPEYTSQEDFENCRFFSYEIHENIQQIILKIFGTECEFDIDIPYSSFNFAFPL